MAKLTARTIETIKASEVRREVPDALLPGLYLIVQVSGAKSWAVRYRHHGRPRKHTLGSYPALDLATARELGRKELRTAAEGRDPAAEKRAAKLTAAAKSAALIDGMLAQFLAEHVRTRKGTPIRARHKNEVARLLGFKPDPQNPAAWIATGNGALAQWQGRPVASITRDDVRGLVTKLASTAPVVANRTLAALKTAFRWRMDRDDTLARSPCNGVAVPAPETPRDRVLNDRELALVWNAADKLGWPFGPALKLLILTGQRRAEVGGMEWRELDLDKHIWTLPSERTKNGQRHEVPLSRQALAIVASLPRVGERYLFTLDGAKPVNTHHRAKRRLDALLPPDIPPLVVHDIRRTVASGMARLGVSLPVIEKILNHQSGSFAGIVRVYQHHEYAEEKREALQRWADHVEALVAGGQR